MKSSFILKRVIIILSCAFVIGSGCTYYYFFIYKKQKSNIQPTSLPPKSTNINHFKNTFQEHKQQEGYGQQRQNSKKQSNPFNDPQNRKQEFNTKEQKKTIQTRVDSQAQNPLLGPQFQNRRGQDSSNRNYEQIKKTKKLISFQGDQQNKETSTKNIIQNKAQLKPQPNYQLNNNNPNGLNKDRKGLNLIKISENQKENQSNQLISKRKNKEKINKYQNDKINLTQTKKQETYQPFLNQISEKQDNSQTKRVSSKQKNKYLQEKYISNDNPSINTIQMNLAKETNEINSIDKNKKQTEGKPKQLIEEKENQFQNNKEWVKNLNDSSSNQMNYFQTNNISSNSPTGLKNINSPFDKANPQNKKELTLQINNQLKMESKNIELNEYTQDIKMIKLRAKQFQPLIVNTINNKKEDQAKNLSNICENQNSDQFNSKISQDNLKQDLESKKYEKEQGKTKNNEIHNDLESLNNKNQFQNINDNEIKLNESLPNNKYENLNQQLNINGFVEKDQDFPLMNQDQTIDKKNQSNAILLQNDPKIDQTILTNLKKDDIEQFNQNLVDLHQKLNNQIFTNEKDNGQNNKKNEININGNTFLGNNEQNTANFPPYIGQNTIKFSHYYDQEQKIISNDPNYKKQNESKENKDVKSNDFNEEKQSKNKGINQKIIDEFNLNKMNQPENVPINQQNQILNQLDKQNQFQRPNPFENISPQNYKLINYNKSFNQIQNHNYLDNEIFLERRKNFLKQREIIKNNRFFYNSYLPSQIINQNNQKIFNDENKVGSNPQNFKEQSNFNNDQSIYRENQKEIQIHQTSNQNQNLQSYYVVPFDQLINDPQILLGFFCQNKEQTNEIKIFSKNEDHSKLKFKIERNIDISSIYQKFINEIIAKREQTTIVQVHYQLNEQEGVKDYVIKHVAYPPWEQENVNNIYMKFKNELQAQLHSSYYNISPFVYACQFHQLNFYILQEILQPLNYKQQFEKRNPLQRQEIYYELFSKLATLHELGYYHQDIKIQNIMTDQSFQHFYFIDFGESVREKNNRLAGTPFYFSFSKCNQQHQLNQADWHALVLTFFIFEQKDNFYLNKFFDNDSFSQIVYTYSLKDNHCFIELRREMEKYFMASLNESYVSLNQMKQQKYSPPNMTSLLMDLVQDEQPKVSTRQIAEIMKQIIFNQKNSKQRQIRLLKLK